MGFLGIGGGDSNQGSGAAFGIVGSAFGGMAANLYGNEQQNNANSYMSDHVMDRQEENARLQMGFQEKMSNSAYQRATADMRQAGINPMMAAGQGGASTPSGASGGGGGATMRNVADGVASTAIDTLRLSNESKLAGSQQALNQAAATKAIQDTQTSASTAKMTDAQAAAVKAQQQALEAEAKNRAARAQYDKQFMQGDEMAKRILNYGNSGMAVKNLLSPFGGPAKQTPVFNGPEGLRP